MSHVSCGVQPPPRGVSPAEGRRGVLWASLAVVLVVTSGQAAGAAGALVFEAESAVRVSGSIEYASAPGASQDLVLHVREGVGADYDERQVRELHARYPDVGFSLAPGQADYTLYVPEAGRYVVWARTYWLWECSNSFWVGASGTVDNMVTDRVYTRWHWVRAEHPVELDEGVQHFAVSNREDGVRIDQFCLTRDRHYRPRGMLDANVLVPRVHDDDPVGVHPAMVAPLCLPHAPTPGRIWLRNSAGLPRTVSVRAWAEGPFAVAVDGVAGVELPARDGLVPIAFAVSVLEQRPFARGTVRCSVTEPAPAAAEACVDVVQMPVWEAAGPFRAGAAAAPGMPRWDGAEQGEPPEPPSGLDALTWQIVDAPQMFTASGRIDLNAVLGPARNAWALVRTAFDWPREMALPVELRSDDQSLVWVNGRLAATHSVVGPGERYYTRVELPLRQGVNVVLIAVHQVDAFWEVSLMPAAAAENR